MKKFLIVLSILLLSGAGYFTYDKWVKHANLTPWNFIPSDAAIVWQSELLKDFDNLRSTTFWKYFEQTEGAGSIAESLAFLDSINGDGGFTTLFKDVPVLISTHKVGSSSLDFLFVIDIQNLSQNTFVSAAIGRLENKGYRFRTRNYNGYSISEIGTRDKLFTFIFYKNFLLASFTPYLVEDAIRTLDDPSLQNFKEAHAVNEGEVFVNYKEFGNLLGSFVSNKNLPPAASGGYELEVDSGFVSFSGLSIPTHWLKEFEGNPAPFGMASIVPTNTSYLFHYTTDNFHDLNALGNDRETKTLRDSLLRLYDFKPEHVYEVLDNEMGVARIESDRPGVEPSLLILGTKDAAAALRYFQNLTERVATSHGDSVYTETYSENQIGFLPINNFPQALLGSVANGFDRCFFVQYRNYLIFSNYIQALRNLLSSIESEETWGKSLRINQFLNRTNQEANVSLFVNVPRTWSFLTTELKDEWKKSIENDAAIYQQAELMAFQFSLADELCYSNFTISIPDQVQTIRDKSTADNSVTLARGIITKPFLVRSHAHSNFDIIVQDSIHSLYFLDQNMTAQWIKEISGPINSDVYEIDYYRNGKLQYAFSTPNMVHILDRTGEYIPGYPKDSPGAKIDHFNVIDYDKSRNYRLAITDESGKVFLTDKEMKLLQGWDPLPYNRRAIQPLHHARIGRKDVMLSIQENGIVNLTNRRGIKESGFPFDSKQTFTDSYFLNPSNSLDRTTLNLLTQQGELLELNLQGNLVDRTQLLKNSPNTAFELISDVGGKSFIILRKDANDYDVLDAAGNMLFSKDYLAENLITQFYRFGAGKDLILFTDPASSSQYLYDINGDLISGNPLKSNHEASVIYSTSKQELQVFTTTGSNLEYYEFDY